MNIGISLFLISCSKSKNEDTEAHTPVTATQEITTTTKTTTPSTQEDTTTPAATAQEDVKTVSVQGNVMLGALSGGAVKVYPILPSGQPDFSVTLGTTTTDSDGNYSLDFNVSNSVNEPVFFQVKGGSYLNEATGNKIELGTNSISTITSLASNAPTVAITPLTEIASQYFIKNAQANLANAIPLAQQATNANYAVEQAFGIPDIVSTKPANPTGPTQIPSTANGQYTIALAAISKIVNSLGVEASDITDGIVKALTAQGELTSLVVKEIKNSDGEVINSKTISFADLSTTMTAIAAGASMPGLTAPLPSLETFTIAKVNTNPTKVAPTDYKAGRPDLAIPKPSTPIPTTPLTVSSGNTTKEVPTTASETKPDTKPDTTTPPVPKVTDMTLSINSGAASTKTTSVNLTLTANNAKEMYINESADCSAAGKWEKYPSTSSKTVVNRAWIFQSKEKTVTISVKFKNNADVESSCINAQIIHENPGPTSTSIALKNIGKNKVDGLDVTLLLEAVDAVKMCIKDASDSPCTSSKGDWIDFATTYPWIVKNEKSYVYAKFMDAQGNESDFVSSSLDTKISVTSLVINEGAAFTNSSTVTLTLTSTNAQKMYITNVSPDCSSGTCKCNTSEADWLDFSSTVTNWPLAQLNGKASVFAKFRDVSLNESACINASITHDNTPPTLNSFAINGGAATTYSKNVSLAINAAGADQLTISNFALASGCPLSKSSQVYDGKTKDWTLEQSTGTATVYVMAQDLAGNNSNCTSASIQILPSAPTAVTYLEQSSATGSPTPTVTVTGVVAGNTVYVAKDSSCNDTVGSAIAAADGNVDITTSTLTTSALNTYQTLYAKQVDSSNNSSSCSATFLTYRVSPGGLWTNLTTGPSARRKCTNCTDPSGNLWCYGGGDTPAGQQDLYKFDISTYTWSQPVQNGTSPGPRHGSSCWFDTNGNMWFFGGTDGSTYYNDLKMYQPSSATWSSVTAANPPSVRSDMSYATDRNGVFWLFGGGTSSYLNDLWQLKVADVKGTLMATWVSVDIPAGTSALYNTTVGDETQTGSYPGALYKTAMATDSSNNIWLFGGRDNGANCEHNDLWKFNTKFNRWTWMSGSNGCNSAGSYSGLGSFSDTAYPAARYLHPLLIDAKNVLWLFGGNNNTAGTRNDLWKYSIATGKWAWMSGSSGFNASAALGTSPGTPDSAVVPSGTSDVSAWIDPLRNLFIFGGYEGASSGLVDYFWRYVPE